MAENLSCENEFKAWLPGEISQDKIFKLYPCYAEIEKACRDAGIIQKPLFEITDNETVSKIYNYIKDNRGFHIRHFSEYSKYLAAVRGYSKFIRQRSEKSEKQHKEINSAQISGKAPNETEGNTNSESQTQAENKLVHNTVPESDIQSDIIVNFEQTFDYSFLKPYSFSYFGEYKTPCKSWRELYITFVSTLAKENPDKFGREMSFEENGRVDLTVKQQNDMVLAEPVPKTMYFLELNYGANAIVSRMKAILDMCAVDYSNVVIKCRHRSYVNDKFLSEHANAAGNGEAAKATPAGGNQIKFEDVSSAKAQDINQGVQNPDEPRPGPQPQPQPQPISNANIPVLQDLGALISQTKQHYNQNYVWQDVKLTTEFKTAYWKYLNAKKWQIKYCDATAVITSPVSTNIYIPNQCFVIATYAVGVYAELKKYKSCFEKVSNALSKNEGDYAELLKNSTSPAEKDEFLKTCENTVFVSQEDHNIAKRSAIRLWRFVTDYSWWAGNIGEINIADAEFYVPVILNMLGLDNSYQKYIVDIIESYETDNNLKELVGSLETFTKNMRGVTYGIEIQDEDDSYTGYGKTDTAVPAEGKKSVHKISISKESIERIKEEK